MITKGQIIKMLREEKGLTQPVLAEGICNQTTLSRVESGRQEPSSRIFNQLIEKMGENPQSYMFAMTTTEKRAIELDREITNLLDGDKYEEAEKLLEEMESLKELDEGSRGFVRFSRIFIATGRGLPKIEAIKELNEAFSWLSKLVDKAGRYQRTNYTKCLLSKNDLQVLSFLAICYIEVEEAQAIEIFYLQKLYIERVIADDEVFANSYTAVTYNLSRQLGGAQKYEEALTVAEDGLKWADQYDRSAGLDGLILNKACVLIEMDNVSVEGVELLNLCYLSFKRKDRHTTCEKIRAFALNHDVSIIF